MGKEVEPVVFARPFIGKEEEKAVTAVLRSGWLTTGKETLEFEKEFEHFLQSKIKKNADGDLANSLAKRLAKSSTKSSTKSAASSPLYCIAVNSATSGLHLALEASGIGQGDLVLLPSMTFAASAEVVRYLGAEPVFVDTAKDSYHIDPSALESTLARLKKGLSAYPPRKTGEGFGPSGKARAVMPVHYGGLPCDMDAILNIAKKYSLKVIEDSAHSFPAFASAASGKEAGGLAGVMGDAGVFSFYATKTITTGEGGMVVTRDKAMADRIHIMRLHGIDRSVWRRYSDTKASWYYEVVEAGYKYNLSDILSALGRVQLRRAMDLLAMREEIAHYYDEAFKDNAHLSIPPTAKGDARHLYPLRLKLEKLSIGRNEFAEKMQAEGIGISVHFIPLHIMPYYKKRYSLKSGDFPETFDTFNRSISLPIWPGMTKKQIKRVISVVKSLCSEYTKSMGPKRVERRK